MKAGDYPKKALPIAKQTGDRKKAADYQKLGIMLHSQGQHCKAKECHEKAFAIKKKRLDIGKEKQQFTLRLCFVLLANM